MPTLKVRSSRPRRLPQSLLRQATTTGAARASLICSALLKFGLENTGCENVGHQRSGLSLHSGATFLREFRCLPVDLPRGSRTHPRLYAGIPSGIHAQKRDGPLAIVR